MAASEPRRVPKPRRGQRSSTRSALMRLDVRHGTADQLAALLEQVFQESSLDAQERVQLLGGALVMEALRPYWGADRSPHDAHEALRRDDPELARVIEAIAPMLLGRVEAQEEGRAAVEAVEALLGR
jgi:hypothetical protein